MTSAFTPEAESARLLISIIRKRLAAVDTELLNAQNAAGTGDTSLALGALYGLEERLASVIALVGATRTTLRHN